MTAPDAQSGQRPHPIALELAAFPWNRPLTTAALRNFSSVASLFAGNPREPRAWQDVIARVTAAPRDRQAISALIQTQLTRRHAHSRALEGAQALADAGTVAVVTGQQAGLFGGPLYTVLKAVTAIQLARQVERDHHVRVVPVFWVEADDHDWAEVRTAHVLDADHRVRDITAADLPGSGKLPVARLTLDEGAADVVEALAATLPPSAFSDELRTQLLQHYRPGVSFAQAFAGFIDSLFAPHGLVVFEAYVPEAKAFAADLFASELANPGRTARLAKATGNTMRSLGHEPQVDPNEDSTALFYLAPEGRESIKIRDGAFLVGETTRPFQDLETEAQAHPERFSGNVLLRPLVQDRLLPTICYVAGPAELAYQAQLGDAYKAFGVPAPLLMPRVSATLLDSAAARFLERHGLALADLHMDEDTALKRIIERSLPTGVDEGIEAMQRAIEERAPALRSAVADVDRTLGGAVDTTLDRMRDSLKSLHGKIVQASKRNDDTLRRQFQRTYALIYPGGEPQERVLSVAFFLNRYGPELVQQLIEILPLETDRHYVITL